jgi:peptidoglycan/LPS O-acetylase OafA/YrhL
MGHFQVLSGTHDLPFPFIYQDVAVDAFFIVSGFLITSSFDVDGNLRRFFTRRLFRLYPLYLVVVLLQAGAMVYLAQGTLKELLQEASLYVLANAFFMNFLSHDIGNVLVGLPTPAINPSLWTLKIEVGFYLILPFIWMLVRRYGGWLLAVIFVVSTVYSYSMSWFGMLDLGKQLPGQMQYFVLGVALYRYRGAIPRATTLASRLTWSAMVVAAFVFASFHIRAPIIYPLAMATVVFGTAMCIWPINLRLDLSYGIYLGHGPVIQIAQVVGWYRLSVVGFVAISLAVIVLATLAERTVERPFIAVGRRLSMRTAPSGAALARAG